MRRSGNMKWSHLVNIDSVWARSIRQKNLHHAKITPFGGKVERPLGLGHHHVVALLVPNHAVYKQKPCISISDARWGFLQNCASLVEVQHHVYKEFPGNNAISALSRCIIPPLRCIYPLFEQILSLLLFESHNLRGMTLLGFPKICEWRRLGSTGVSQSRAIGQTWTKPETPGLTRPCWNNGHGRMTQTRSHAQYHGGKHE